MMTLNELIEEAKLNSGIANIRFNNHEFMLELVIDLNGHINVGHILDVWIKSSIALEDCKDNEDIKFIVSYDVIGTPMRGVLKDAFDGNYIYHIHDLAKAALVGIWPMFENCMMQ